MRLVSFIRPWPSMRIAGVRLQQRLAVLFPRANTQPFLCESRIEECRFRDEEYHSGALDEIRSDWAACGLGEAPSDREIVGAALHLMQLEIDAGLGDEVLEDLRREVEYRRWCAADECAPAVPMTEGENA